MLDCTTLFSNNSKRIGGVDVRVVLLADSAFKLSTKIKKPYPFNTTQDEERKSFNYALSRSRRVVENAFGQLKARFRRIVRGVDNHIDKVPHIIYTCCVLHNFLNCHNSDISENWEAGSNVRTQPESSSTAYDFDSSAENIRKALARHVHNK
ncbi:putative nuclease HARBI1 [Drosophila innubila]|uniref:putative nuclease HARBI1 n=1 Tax=Drosophila innubila TaxID=198719 RepID=UPI00148DA079|nr:putative nuclease HARBI1 [Drosophila innubila]